MISLRFERRDADDPAIGVAALIAVDSRRRVALIRDAKRDWWSVPAGKREPGETGAETATREVYEEAQIRVDPPRLLGVATLEGQGQPYALLVYLAAIRHIDPFVPGREATERAFVPLAELAGRVDARFAAIMPEVRALVEAALADGNPAI